MKIVKKRKANILKKECVACGCCIKACPKSAIEIVKGIYAAINKDLCIGCAKCRAACPASIINITEVMA